jgi:phage terminase large subunit
MPYQLTTATKKIAGMTKRLRAVQGGTSASKTVSIVLWLINLAQSDKKPVLTSIVSESFPHLKRGTMRDFLSIMEEHRYYKDANWNKSDYIYTFETGSRIEFFSADQPDKVRGPRRDRLFINEANNIPYHTFDQLEVRTKDFIYLDWNPVSEFWFYTEILNRRDDVEHITLTYRDNEALDPQIRKSIEQRKDNKNWWKVFGEGQLGEVEGRIYTGWQIIDGIPHEARLERYGLDFGYTNDEAAIVALYRYNGGYILDEITYQKGLFNNNIADILKNIPPALVVADSAEPKSIDEIKKYGVNVIGAKKLKEKFGTKHSYLKWSISQVQNERISVTKNSVNLIREYRNYLWQVDKDGRTLNEPTPGMDHLLDATRYAITSLVPIINRQEIIEARPIFINTTARRNPAR